MLLPVERVQEWIKWAAARSFPYVQSSQCSWLQLWPKLNPSVMVVLRHIEKGKKLLFWRNCRMAVRSWRTTPSGNRPVLEKFIKNCSLWEVFSVGQIVSRGRDPTLEQRKGVKSPPPKAEGVEETTCGEVTADPTPCPPAPLGEAGREFRSED